MADNQWKSGPLAIPMMLIGLLAAGALVPHLSPSPARQAPLSDGQGPAGGTAAAAVDNLDSQHVTNVLDLLAEYFGVDTPLNYASDDPGAPIRRAAARHSTSLEFLIATVPDPIDSYETWQFDPQIDAIRQGIEASGYLLDRFFLPDTRIDPKATKAPTLREVHQHWPGVILFRSKKATSLLVLFLIPETPVAGIHQEPFSHAIQFVDDWMNREAASAPGPIRILGPTFSGSTPSIVRGLVNFDDASWRKTSRDVRIVSGSASNDSNRARFENKSLGLKRTSIRFQATMHSNSAITAGMREFLTDAGIEGITASLSESSTAFGDEVVGSKRDVTVKYPFNIAQLRTDTNRDGSAKRDSIAGAIPTLRPLSFEDATVPTDQFPLRNPATMSSSVELVLSTLLEAVRREHVRIVNIDATDVRDKLFLIKEVRERAPDVLITSTDGDLFQVHPDQARWLTGLVIASTYPLHLSSQDFAYPFHGESGVPRPNGDLMQFSSVNMEGHYNAAIALLNYTIDGEPLPRYKGGMEDPLLPKLLDYGGIGRGCEPKPEKDQPARPTTIKPGVWISIVGDGQIIPLRVYCNKDLNDYVFAPRLQKIAEVESMHDVSATGPTMVLIGIALFAGTAAIVFASLCRKIGRPETVGAIGLGLCGALIPLAALAVIIPAEAWQLWQLNGARERWSALAAMAVGAWCWWIVVYAVAFQFRSRALAGLRAVFAVAAGLLAWYVIVQIAVSPQLFLQRTLDVGTKMSPLLPLMAFGGVPLVLAVVEVKRLTAFGLASRQSPMPVADSRDAWRTTLESVAPLAPRGLTGIRDALVDSYRTLLFLPGPWKALPIVSTVAAFPAAFTVDPRPVLSVEGPLFGWSVVAVVLCLQWVFATALAQILYLSCATAQLLVRLARHPDSLPWELVPKELSRTGLVPKAPRLRDLAQLAKDVPGAMNTLQKDLETRPAPRWFQSDTWELMKDRLQAITPATPGTADPLALKGEQTFQAVSVVFVVRELLSRLSFSLYLIGPALALLVVLYSTLYYDHSHALLGLIWVDVVSAIVAIMSVFVWMDRDAVISGINHTTPGTIDWNWEFIWKVVVYVVLPLMTLFAAQFPGIGSSLVKLLEPVQKLPGS